MITKKELIKIRENASLLTNPILPSQLPRVSVDIHSLLEYAKKKGKAACDLSDDEKCKFVSYVIHE